MQVQSVLYCPRSRTVQSSTPAGTTFMAMKLEYIVTEATSYPDLILYSVDPINNSIMCLPARVRGIRNIKLKFIIVTMKE